jgi:hypothetical protein
LRAVLLAVRAALEVEEPILKDMVSLQSIVEACGNSMKSLNLYIFVGAWLVPDKYKASVAQVQTGAYCVLGQEHHSKCIVESERTLLHVRISLNVLGNCFLEDLIPVALCVRTTALTQHSTYACYSRDS